MRAPKGSNIDMRKERLVGSGKSATRGVSDVIMTILWISLPINRLLLLLLLLLKKYSITLPSYSITVWSLVFLAMTVLLQLLLKA